MEAHFRGIHVPALSRDTRKDDGKRIKGWSGPFLDVEVYPAADAEDYVVHDGAEEPEDEHQDPEHNQAYDAHDERDREGCEYRDHVAACSPADDCDDEGDYAPEHEEYQAEDERPDRKQPSE